MVFAVAAVHRSGRFYDQDGNAGGFKPIWDALQWAGWCVTDSKKWFKYVHLDQQRGSDHTLIQVYIPETDEEEAALTEKFRHPLENGNE